eukprot:TRINITY_DN1774_c0_g1_i5.p1 TRINITY_DN1774_c0_g1~~TRINITY_DN1774_c0_g1_i5.p1  ORF type:complete len:139 (+),score=1.73 TRINITY_DN1774_c0_g1_i5:97-513(+)
MNMIGVLFCRCRSHCSHTFFTFSGDLPDFSGDVRVERQQGIKVGFAQDVELTMLHAAYRGSACSICKKCNLTKVGTITQSCHDCAAVWCDNLDTSSINEVHFRTMLSREKWGYDNQDDCFRERKKTSLFILLSFFFSF